VQCFAQDNQEKDKKRLPDEILFTPKTISRIFLFLPTLIIPAMGPIKITAVSPCAYLFSKTVFNGIMVYVMNMVLKVIFVTDLMLLNTTLPETNGICDYHFSLIFNGETPFDGMHNLAENCLPFGFDKKMEMIWQENICDHGKRVKILNRMTNLS
jgi:hypothetical protein